MYLRSFYRVYLTDYVTCMTVLKRVSTFLSLMLKKNCHLRRKKVMLKLMLKLLCYCAQGSYQNGSVLKYDMNSTVFCYLS